MSTRDLIAEVSALPVDERARVADSILKTLNSPNSQIDEKWAEVAQHRLDELRSNQVAPIPGEEVFTRVWKHLGQ